MKMVFPLLSDSDLELPYYTGGVGCNYEQEKQCRQKGFPYYQWIQCRQGTGRLHLNNTVYTIQENQGILMYPNLPHEYYALSDSWEVDWIIFNGSCIEEFFQHAAKMKESGVYNLSHPNAITEKIVQIYHTIKADTPTKSFLTSRLVYEILIDILQYSSVKTENSLASKYCRFDPIFQYIENNYNQVITLSELSSIVGVTPQHLCNSFKETTATTIVEYINNTRIKKSKELLIQNPRLQIKEIALEVGFHDVSYFCAVFRKAEKMSPSEFKQLLT